MGNKNTSSENTTNDDSKIDQKDCNHGYNYDHGEYNLLSNDNLIGIHYKNNYNDALSGESICSHNSLGVLQNVHAVLSTPAKISKECNNCEIKLEIPEKNMEPEKPEREIGYERPETEKYERPERYERKNIDMGSDRWQHRP